MTWEKTIPANPVVAVAGATGAVGREFLKVLHDLDFPASETLHSSLLEHLFLRQCVKLLWQRVR